VWVERFVRAKPVARSPLLLLIGLRCSGKTTLGKAAASVLRIAFEDLDLRVLAAMQVQTVTEAFHTCGEVAFRAAEAKALKEIIDGKVAGIVALGGGTPLVASACACIRAAQAQGWLRVALLHPGLDALVQRLQSSRGDRPRLTHSDAQSDAQSDADSDAAEVVRLSRQRLPLYRSLADITVDTRLPQKECVQRLRALLTSGRSIWSWPQASE